MQAPKKTIKETFDNINPSSCVDAIKLIFEQSEKLWVSSEEDKLHRLAQNLKQIADDYLRSGDTFRKDLLVDLSEYTFILHQQLVLDTYDSSPEEIHNYIQREHICLDNIRRSYKNFIQAELTNSLKIGYDEARVLIELDGKYNLNFDDF